jgi:hypothetical protein
MKIKMQALALASSCVWRLRNAEGSFAVFALRIPSSLSIDPSAIPPSPEAEVVRNSRRLDWRWE